MTDPAPSDEFDTPRRFRRPRWYRLRTSREFKACYNGVRAGDRHLLLFAVNSDHQHPRAGVSVSKKHGNAVCRNCKKRLLREAFRLAQHDLPSLDFVLIPRVGEPSTLQDYQSSLRTLAGRLNRQLNRRPPSAKKASCDEPAD